jgi:hypothetical protein
MRLMNLPDGSYARDDCSGQHAHGFGEEHWNNATFGPTLCQDASRTIDAVMKPA